MAPSEVAPCASAAHSNARCEKRLRVIIVTYYWPPSGGAGVQRWLKMAKCLAAEGTIEPIIFTPANPDPPLRDESLLADVPDGVQIVTYRSFEPSRALRRLFRRERSSAETSSAVRTHRAGLAVNIMRWIRANIFIPDARAFSIRPAARRLSAWIKHNGADAIITTGPPHSMHLIGWRVKRRLALPWVVDFRDPWVDFPLLHYLPLTSAARRRHAALEKRVVEAADRVVVVSPTMQRSFEAAHHRSIDLIFNGYDSDDFVDLPPHLPSQPFTLLHCGEMKDDQSPHALWQTIAELHAEGSISPATLRVELIGRAAPGVRAEVSSAGIERYVLFRPPVAHADLPTILRSASALLLSINRVPSAKGIITGKLFEYLAAGRPILAYGPTSGDTAAIIHGLDAGVLFDHYDTASTRRTLQAWMAAEAEGLLCSGVAGCDAYSRQSEAAEVAQILRALTRTH